MNRRIITAAITGSIHTPTMSSHLPLTPDEIVAETVGAYEAGAAVAHIHARDPKTGAPSADTDLYKEIASKVKTKCDIILGITTGGGLGMTAEQRARSIPILKPELASFNCGSLNFNLARALDIYDCFQFEWERDYLGMTEDFVLTNTFKTLREFSAILSENNTQTELEIYDVGMINNAAYMLEKGYLKRPLYLQFVMGILGGIQPSVRNLLMLHDTAREALGDFKWSVCAAGRHQFSMCTLGLVMGGNVRVGLEDNLYIEKGKKARSNAEQVGKMVRIAGELGLEPATPDEARQMLGLKGLGSVAY